MKNKLILITAFVIITANAMGQLLNETVFDVDSNLYHTIKIGTQIWMAENLKTTKYNNGDPLENAYDNSNFMNYTMGAYLDYGEDINNSKIYGKLYNWYTVNDKRNIAPVGWHVPSDAEWKTLITYLGGENVAGGKLKETSIAYWKSPNTLANNDKGFTALPGGLLNDNSRFAEMHESGYWWSSDEYVKGEIKNGPSDPNRGNAYKKNTIIQGQARYVKIYYNRGNILYHVNGYPENCGLYIRCLKD